MEYRLKEKVEGYCNNLEEEKMVIWIKVVGRKLGCLNVLKEERVNLSVD